MWRRVVAGIKAILLMLLLGWKLSSECFGLGPRSSKTQWSSRTKLALAIESRPDVTRSSAPSSETPSSPKSPASTEKAEAAAMMRVAMIPLVATPMITPVSTLAKEIEKVKEKGKEDTNGLPPLEGMPLPADAYTNLGSTYTCRVLNGMWQVSGAHGYEPERADVVPEMTRAAEAGFTTFDVADIYGPAEDFVGSFRKGKYASTSSWDCQYFTKWVPRPTKMTKTQVDTAIGRSLTRMQTGELDLLQFHWWDYDNKYYFNAMDGLMGLRQQGQIKNIGLTNFDTEHMLGLLDQGAPLVSNQVAFSIIDARPLELMVPACTEKGVKLLCYATLMGGFLSERWIGKPEPSMEKLTNVSLRKYLPWIRAWGGWGLLQELLRTLGIVAKKHNVSVSNVAVRWVLQQAAVGGAIVGVRMGLSQHVEDNKRTFSFALDGEDLAAIDAVRSKGRNLMDYFGDCGGEYRRI